MEESAPRSASRSRPPSRPVTPLRPSSRSSIREHGYGASRHGAGYSQPAIHALEPQFAELADSMADLEANFMHLQLMHESLTRFSESFASFLYGLNMNAFCVDFPEAPISESFRRAKQAENQAEDLAADQYRSANDGETTFLTTDTTFVDNPPATVSSKATPKPSRASARGSSTRGAIGNRYSTRGTARGSGRAGRPSALPRGRGINLPRKPAATAINGATDDLTGRLKVEPGPKIRKLLDAEAQCALMGHYYILRYPLLTWHAARGVSTGMGMTKTTAEDGVDWRE
ncbi:DASH complex component Dam1, putative [Paecilomyces variotii No. 5]|uniref:DASH complex subunit DAM1 n=1 Tax=Byssochlamys spectabilis (strain No. 5 / NBRC 109023) TaxID=1356009 RepID=V5HTZ3_BYSSN|nr:DASH complex component Dam1, putative [Paecilomyces variotii No. 5]